VQLRGRSVKITFKIGDVHPHPLTEGDGNVGGSIGVEQSGELVVDVPDAHPEAHRRLSLRRVRPEKTREESARAGPEQCQRGDQALLPMRYFDPPASPGQRPAVEQGQEPLRL
jgi:hypothetical protein